MSGWELSARNEPSEAPLKTILPEQVATKANDSAAVVRLHTKLMGHYLRERSRQGPNRRQMAIDEDYYDSRQWRAEDMAVLQERGQPALVFNRIKTPINWVIGTEKQQRKEFKVLPREESDGANAEIKHQVLSFLDDVNRSDFHRGKAFEECVISGIGWSEVGYDENLEQGIFSRSQWWREMYQDSLDKSFDLSESRYVIRVKYVDLDTAIGYFPEKESMLRQVAMDEHSLAHDDLWYFNEKLNTVDPYAELDDTFGDRSSYITGDVFDGGSDQQVKFIEVRYRVPIKGSGGKSEIRFALLIDLPGGIIYDIPNPYKHDSFGFVPRYCYRVKSTNMPYGLIRDLRDAQEDHNKRRSKALHLLNTRRVTMTKGAVEDIERLREEAARPDAILEYEPGHEFQLSTDSALAAEQLQLASMSAQHIESGMGVTDENLGRSTNAISGRAILGRQTQGTTVMAGLIENNCVADQILGELTLSLMEQFYDQPKVIRLTQPNGQQQFIQLNQPASGDQQVTNSIVNTKADFVLAKSEASATARQAMFEQLLQIAGMVAPTMPQASQVLTMAALQMSDMPNAANVLEELRSVLGMRDPTKPLTPEETQQRQQQKQAQEMLLAQQAQLEMQTKELTNQQLKQDIEQSVANILKTQAEASDKRTEAIYSAVQTALQILQNPTAAPIADSIARDMRAPNGIPDAVIPKAATPVYDVRDGPIDPAATQQPPTPGIGQNAGMNSPEADPAQTPQPQE